MQNHVRVLIVDDCADTARSMALLAELWGHQVWVAHDGPAALATALTCRPDVVLLDIGLPNMSGYEVARKVREQLGPSGPRIVAITGYGLEQHLKLGREAGFDLHLLKPVHPDTLRDVLSGPADRSRGERSEDWATTPLSGPS